MMKRIAAGLLAMLLLSGLAQAEVFQGEPPAEWADQEVLAWTIFDANEGDAMLLECGGESILVDGGPDPVRKDLCKALEARGLKNSMKYILNTHYHEDHISGIYQLFRNGFTAGAFLHQYNDWAVRNNKLLGRTVKAAEKNEVPVRRVGAGDVLTFGEAKLELYHCTEIRGTNARSLVGKVTFKDASILLCADITGKVQRWYLANLPQDALKADLIKLPHHAITPVVPAFLDAVAPEGAIATNRSRDIASKSLTQLEGRGLPTFFSGDGTVYAVTDGTDWYIYQTLEQF